VFSYLKFFAATLPHEHDDNFYMEREWRKRDGLSFTPENVAALYLPPAYKERLLAEHPAFDGKLRVLH